MIARVFPRKTSATPTDNLAFIGGPDLFSRTHGITEVHVSVSFTWDLPEAERIAKEWEDIAPVKIGGPATGMRGEEFVPGKYVKPGYVITSRGCNNRCWFCSVWKREGGIRELPVHEGWNVLDDNLLSTSREHQENVFSMLCSQKTRPRFTGGLEARLLELWHVKQIAKIDAHSFFFAYDTEDDLEPLSVASKMLYEYTKFTWHQKRCFVLVGYPKDTMEDAESRIEKTIKLDFMPMAMLWRGNDGKTEKSWRKFQKFWSRPAYIAAQAKQKGYRTMTMDPSTDELRERVPGDAFDKESI